MAGLFPTTRWTLLQNLRDGDTSETSREVLEQLCADYWEPIYAYFRRQGNGREAAEDLTQEFFAIVVRRDLFTKADRDKGRLRTFLLECARRLAVDVQRKQYTAKRGGGCVHVSLDFQNAESWVSAQLTTSESPELAFDREWATNLVMKAWAKIERDWPQRDLDLLADLRRRAQGEEEPAYPELARRHGITEVSARKKVSRLRELLRDEIEAAVIDTCATEADARVEFEYLKKILS